ncbi:N-acetylmuramoyl-L-alanine amidase, partial [Pseudogracilibacillus auburnensis]|uniref:N-acetylmuramoyl-L-alanine amidase n=1 Tax=Pseudogracilibacillus auburnensis TaxID=1494959 RepID=UPI001A97C8E1
NIYGYVRKANTIPDHGSSLKNKNSTYKNQSRSFKALKDVVIYDNTSGSLLPYGVIDKGQSYPIATDYGNWWRIVFSDRVGYVRKSDVDSEFLKSDKYFRAEGNIPIYDNRSGSLKKVGELKKGQIYPRVSDYGNWHRIQFGDIYGYVRKSGTSVASGSSIKNLNKNYKNQSRTFTPLETATVYDNTSGKLVPFGTIDKGATFPIATDYGNWWRIVFSDRVGYVRKSDVESEFIKSDKYFKAKGNIPIYDNRSGSLKKVGELKKGQIYPRVSDYGNWHRIQFGDIYGYVRKSETSVASGSSIKNLNINYKNQSRTFTALEAATVYDNTSGKLVPFGIIDKGPTFPIATDYGNWWRIIFSDRVGYVRKSSVHDSVEKNIKIFIDPGHGGNDSGATGNGLREKDLTLAISKSIADYLINNYSNVEVRLSRTNDTFITLEDRAKMANSWKADYFLSAHINAGGGTGFESYVHPTNNSNQSKKYQDIVHENVAKEAGERDRGKKTADFSVLRNTDMPAILLEYLFIDSKSDSEKLKQQSYINKLGKATAEGIAKAFNLKRK